MLPGVKLLSVGLMWRTGRTLGGIKRKVSQFWIEDEDFMRLCMKDDPKGLWSLFDDQSLECVAFGVKRNRARSPDVL